ncbi:MAG TPA: carboxypeptidase regulatory-like domain-containing protein [Candidatus Binataceae bacterium]|nr:carboxypeptidase regulatory-like domain-containing protein [Candidatus Binataceae bacterium]
MLLALTLSALGATALCRSSVANAYQATTVANPGKIVGTITYAGTPPKPLPLEVSKDRDVCGAHPLFDQSLIVGKNGGIANAVVSLPDIAKGKPLALKPVTFDQKGCEYIPHVAAFPAGDEVDVINSDNILHNIHSESTLNPVIDVAQPGFKKVIKLKVEKPEVIKIGCDAHNWMEGWWYVTANPYYAVSGADGHYEVSDVPPGTYQIEVWQEKLGTRTRRVTVAPGQTVTVDFTMAPASR